MASHTIPSFEAQKLVISLKVKIALLVARENEFLWNPPPEVFLSDITTITAQAIKTVEKMTAGKISTLLDYWYMACTRVIMMTPMMSQLSRYHRGIELKYVDANCEMVYQHSADL